MVAAERYNEREWTPNDKVYAAVTIGERWKFLDMKGTTVTIDAADYYIKDIAKILAILLNMALAARE